VSFVQDGSVISVRVTSKDYLQAEWRWVEERKQFQDDLPGYIRWLMDRDRAEIEKEMVRRRS